MSDLEITWPDGEARFSPEDSPVQIGRSSTAAVPLTEGSVSRRHLELVWGGSVWIVNDSSTHGTFDPIGIRLAPRWSVTDETTVRLGGVEGVQVHLRTVDQRQGGQAEDGNDQAAGAGVSGLFPHADNGHVSQNGPRPSTGVLFPDQNPEIFRNQSPDAAPAILEQAMPAAEVDHGSPPVAHSPAPAPPPPAPPAAAPEPEVFSQAEVAEAALAKPSGAGLLGVSLEGEAGPGATGGHPAIHMDPNATIISDATLRLNVGGQDYSFVPGADVTVGRDPSCLVKLDERHSLVSRQHLRITFRDDHWWLEDFSSKGTFISGKAIRGPYRAEGAFIANLGDDEAGTPMRIITAGEHKAPRSTSPLLIAALAAAALIPLVVLAFILTRSDSPSTDPDFASAKQSTVMLFGMEGGQGSGFFVSDNLILTNQHVAVLSPQMLVAVSRNADEPAQIEYATELVANHPFLDIAVLRVSNRVTMTGAGPEISADPVGGIALPSVTMGDSDAITIGDPVFSTGFPGRLSITSTNDAGELRLPPVVASSGHAASFTIWPGCSNPDFETFIPADSPPGVACSAGGDIERGVLLSTFSSGQGASGSPVFRDNEVVAVVYAGAAEENNASLNISTSAFSGWLQEIVDGNP